MDEFVRFRRELRDAILLRNAPAPIISPQPPQSLTAADPSSTSKPPINLHLLGPQGSGKTSFIRTCFRALLGGGGSSSSCSSSSPRSSNPLPKEIRDLELELYRTDDGTSKYNKYKLTEGIYLHDTRGQREYSGLELEQLKLVLDGRALPNSVIQQRKRYWLMLREFWKSDEEMQKTFSHRISLPRGSLRTEPHFVFLAVDPNQQNLLFEDEDFRDCYRRLLADFKARQLPFAVLCTHGDLLTGDKRRMLGRLPRMLGLGSGCLSSPLGESGREESGYFRTDSFDPTEAAAPASAAATAPAINNGNSAGSRLDSEGAGQASQDASEQDRLPDTIRIVTNYTKPLIESLEECKDDESLCEEDVALPLPTNAFVGPWPPQPPEPPVIPSAGGQLLLGLQGQSGTASSSTLVTSAGGLLSPPSKAKLLAEKRLKTRSSSSNENGVQLVNLLESENATANSISSSTIGPFSSSSSGEESSSSSARSQFVYNGLADPRTSEDEDHYLGGSGVKMKLEPQPQPQAAHTQTQTQPTTTNTSTTALLSAKNLEEFNEPAEDVQRDIHILLVLLDAINQAEWFIEGRQSGEIGEADAGSAEGEVVGSGAVAMAAGAGGKNGGVAEECVIL